MIFGLTPLPQGCCGACANAGEEAVNAVADPIFDLLIDATSKSLE